MKKVIRVYGAGANPASQEKLQAQVDAVRKALEQTLAAIDEATYHLRAQRVTTAIGILHGSRVAAARAALKKAGL